MNSKLSVIIPVFNGEKYLKECLDSIVNQDIGVNNFEVIVVNDNSTDNSLNIINDYALKYSNFTVISNESNYGAGQSRNIGIKNVKTDYLTFVDCDDFISENAFRDCLLKIKENDADLLIYNWQTFTGTDYVEPINIHQQSCDENVLIEGIDENPKLVFSTSSWNKIYHKSLYPYLNFSNGLYDDNLAVVKSLVNAKKIFLSKDATYFYRKNLDSTTENITPRHALDLCDSIKQLDDLNNAHVNLLNIKFINDILFWVYFYDWDINDEISIIEKLKDSVNQVSSLDLDNFRKLFPDYEVFYREDCLNLDKFDSETFLAKYKYFNRLAKVKSQASIYVDDGNGFSEVNKISVEYIPQKNNKLTFDLLDFENIKNLRFDPLEGAFIKCRINNLSVLDANCDNSVNDEFQIFITLDPNYIIDNHLNSKLTVDFDLEFLNNNELANLFIEKNNVINEFNQNHKKSRFNFLK